MKNVLIVGYGDTGKAVFGEYARLNPAVVDKHQRFSMSHRQDAKYDLAFICVDTPATDTMICDITEVINALKEYNAKVFVLKSTVLPGTSEYLSAFLKKRIVFSPEFSSTTPHGLDDTDFTILGGNEDDTCYVQQILQHAKSGCHRFIHATFKEAELAKYMINSFLAMKVSFCDQFWLLSRQLGINYERLRELFILDSRVGCSHTFVDNEHPYWDSYCLNKDVSAIASTMNKTDGALLHNILRFNEYMKDITNKEK